jgi:hypothetical protein
VKFSRPLPAHITDAWIKDMAAQIRAAGEDAATNPLTFDDILQALRTLERPQPEDGHDLSAAQRKRRAATIRREIAARTDELKQCGVCNPVERAEEEIAKRWQHASGAALNRWLRRHR